LAKRGGAPLAGKGEALTRLAVEMYARGPSMRDIEAAFADTSLVLDGVYRCGGCGAPAFVEVGAPPTTSSTRCCGQSLRG